MNATDPSSDADPLVALAEEFADRYRRGERPALAEYTDLYPHLAERIRKLFPAMLVMEEFGSVAGPGAEALGGDGAPPRQLGEYRVLREVGRGGMGVVYEAVQESLGRHVALKVLSSRNWKNPTHLERFRREARAVARLHHTSIVPVFGVGECDGAHYYAMQFIQGQSLDHVIDELKRLRRVRSSSAAEPPAVGDGKPRPAMSASLAHGLVTGRFPDACAATASFASARPDPVPTPPFVSWGGEEGRGLSDQEDAKPAGGSRTTHLTTRPDAEYVRGVARVGVQAAEALAYAHAQGILHRDIKPGNLLLDTQGTVWVTDFGLAKADDGGELTGDGDIVGTVRYMAPERFRGEADPRSDVYGLGLTLYEMLTLRPAYDAADRPQLIDRIAHANPPAPRTIDAQIPRDLETVVLKAIAREPDHRYPTAAALANDLRLFLADRPILARRTTWAEHGWRWCRRNPAVAGLLTAVGALLAVTVVVLAVGNARIRGALHQEKQAKDELVQRLYYQWIAAAAHERAGNRHTRAEELLEQCAPALRGWEWHYLKRHPFAGVLKLPHDDIVNRVAWSPDGALVASGSRKGWVKVWDARTGTLVFHLQAPRKGLAGQAHQGFVRGLAFSPDGRLLATGGEDDRVTLWDMRTGEFLRDFPTGPGTTMLHALEFSPDGRHLAAATQDRKVRLWDLAGGGEVLLSDDLLATGGLAFTPEGRLIIVSAEGGVKVVDVSGRQTATTFRAQTRAAGYTVAFSRERRLLALGCEDGTVKVLSTEPLEEVRTLEAHAGEISGLAFGAGDERLASAGDDLSVKVWDLRTGQEAIALDIVTRRANGLAFSPDGHRLAVGSADGFVQILDGTPLQGAGDAGQLLTLEGHSDAVTGLEYSPDGGQVASASRDGTAKVRDANTGREVVTLRGHQAPLTAIVWAPDGWRIATASWDGTARVWDTATGAEVLPALGAGPGPVYGLAFTRDGSALATAHHDGSVRVWDAATGRPTVRIPQAHMHPVLGVAFSPGGEHLASAGGKDNTVKVWKWQAGDERPVQTLKAPGNIIRNPVYSPDGRRLVAVVATPAKIWSWDTTTGEGKDRALLGASKVSQALFTPGGRLAVVSSGRVQFLKPDGTDGPALVGRHAGEIGCAAFSPDGKRMATGAGYKGRGEVRIWDVARWEEVP